MFDEVMKMSGLEQTAVVREVPRAGQGAWQTYTASTAGGAWAPIRIKVFTEDLNNRNKYCTRVGDVRSDFRRREINCTKDNILTAEKKELLLNFIIPNAVKMHTDRLLVQPVVGNLVLPRFYNLFCNEFTVPSSHRKTGVPGADMVLYAAAGPMIGAAAWAAPCSAFDAGRPLVGVFNYDPKHIVKGDKNVRVGAHEIAHALGFGIEQMKYSKMVIVANVGRGKKPVSVVNSPKTLEKARAHYRCQSISGMELEDEGEYGTVGSHWERRNARDELMAGISEATLYTSLTMAAFEDMGFYRANWGNEEVMNWGRNAGCAFLEKKCIENGVVNFPNMFCNKKTPPNQAVCTFDRKALGYCQPTAELMDNCPFVRAFSNQGCMDSHNETLPWSRAGPNSRCVKGDSLAYGHMIIGDICVEVSCKNDTVKIRYIGDDTWHACPKGGHITPNKPFSGGRILCPEPDEVCSFGGGGRRSRFYYSSSSAASVSPFLVSGLPVYVLFAAATLITAVLLV